MGELGGPDDRRGDTGLVQEPRQRDLGRGDASLGGDLGDTLDHVEVGRLVVEEVGERVGVRASGALLAFAGAVPGEYAASEGAPWDHAHPLVEALGDHLALLFPVEEVVMVLHRDEPRPAGALGGMLRLGELPRVHAARTDVAGLARAYDLVECAHRLLDRRVRVVTVNLVQVDVLEIEALE
jgi:hypothetical protein